MKKKKTGWSVYFETLFWFDFPCKYMWMNKQKQTNKQTFSILKQTICRNLIHSKSINVYIDSVW